MTDAHVLIDKLSTFKYYEEKLPLYLQNSYGFKEHFRIWFDLLCEQAESVPEGPWTEIKRIVAAGLAPQKFKVRDQLTCKKGNTTLVWDILGFDCDEAANGNYHTMTIQLHDCLLTTTIGARQALFYFPNGLEAGTYNFTVTENPWVSGDIGKTLQFTLTNDIPVGGQLVTTNTYNATMVNSKVQTYSGPTSTDIIDEVTLTEGSSGTSLGNVGNSMNGNTNSIQRAGQGNGNYNQTPMRQYLNSDKEADQYWTPQTVWDRPLSWTSTRNGFLYDIDEDFKNAIGEVKKITVLNSKDGGGLLQTIEKCFLLSMPEVYGGVIVSGEGEPYPYYSDYSSLLTPGTGSDSNRIKMYNDAASAWWLRSPSSNLSNQIRYIGTSGNFSLSSVTLSRGLAPACVVVGDIDTHSSSITSTIDLLFEMLNIFDLNCTENHISGYEANQHYLNFINCMEDSEKGTKSDILDKIGNLFGLKRRFSLTVEGTTCELNLNNADFLTLIRCTIIKNYFDGSFEQISKYYKDAGLPVFVLTTGSAQCEMHLIDLEDSEYAQSADIQKMFLAGLLTVESVGISYTYSIHAINNLAIFDSEESSNTFDNGVFVI